MRALSARARRAVALMLVAATSLAAISLYYLRPWTAFQANFAAKPLAVVPTPGLGHLVNFYFVSSALGWSVVTTYDPITNSQESSYWLYKTVDAGKHWERQLSGKTARLFLTYSSLWFADPETGYIVAGDPIVLYRTQDGGDHWKAFKLPLAEVQGLQFVDASNGFVITTAGPEETSIFATPDGGESWTQLPAQPANQSFWPQFRSRSEAWTGWADRTPSVYVSVDGGTTWERRDLPRKPGDPPGRVGTSVQVGPGGLVLVYVSNLDVEGPATPGMYSSIDDGKSWTRVNTPASDPNGIALSPVGTDKWWAIQDAELFTTEDAGRSWQRIGVVPENLRLLTVLDPAHAWAQLEIPDDNHELLLTSDGGHTWDRANTPPLG